MAKQSTKSEAAYSEALWRIKSCRKQGVETVDLSDLGLTTLPLEVCELPVTKLNVHGNNLTTLPPEIGSITYLKELNLNRNWLKTLPREIGGLMALRTLDLSHNQISKLPREIGRLTRLTSLDVGDNQL